MNKISIILLLLLTSAANAADSDKYQEIPQTIISNDIENKVTVEIHKAKGWRGIDYKLVRVNTDDVFVVLVPGYREPDSIIEGKSFINKWYKIKVNGSNEKIRFITKNGNVFYATTKIIDDSE